MKIELEQSEWEDLVALICEAPTPHTPEQASLVDKFQENKHLLYCVSILTVLKPLELT